MNLGFFCCLFMLSRDGKYYETIEDMSGLSKNHPILSLSMLLILFSLAGIPPLAGFFAKFYVFMAVIKQGMYFLACYTFCILISALVAHDVLSIFLTHLLQYFFFLSSVILDHQIK